MTERRDEPDPTRIVADPVVLAADLLVGGAARESLDHVRRHSWVDLVASDKLLTETESLVAVLADDDLAAAHRERLEADRVAVDQPPDDHPALASAYRGEAAHLLSYDERLNSARAGLTLQPRVAVSVRPPDAFARLFDPESLYEAVVGGEYPGPDCDPREQSV
jgi:predicted nucleic acid-binding protein